VRSSIGITQKPQYTDSKLACNPEVFDSATRVRIDITITFRLEKEALFKHRMLFLVCMSSLSDGRLRAADQESKVWTL